VIAIPAGSRGLAVFLSPKQVQFLKYCDSCAVVSTGAGGAGVTKLFAEQLSSVDTSRP
jgi:hypothetical protein